MDEHHRVVQECVTKLSSVNNSKVLSKEKYDQIVSQLSNSANTSYYLEIGILFLHTDVKEKYIFMLRSTNILTLSRFPLCARTIPELNRAK